MGVACSTHEHGVLAEEPEETEPEGSPRLGDNIKMDLRGIRKWNDLD
jgi:hypothetical protein